MCISVSLVLLLLQQIRPVPATAVLLLLLLTRLGSYNRPLLTLVQLVRLLKVDRSVLDARAGRLWRSRCRIRAGEGIVLDSDVVHAAVAIADGLHGREEALLN